MSVAFLISCKGPYFHLFPELPVDLFGVSRARVTLASNQRSKRGPCYIRFFVHKVSHLPYQSWAYWLPSQGSFSGWPPERCRPQHPGTHLPEVAYDQATRYLSGLMIFLPTCSALQGKLVLLVEVPGADISSTRSSSGCVAQFLCFYGSVL